MVHGASQNLELFLAQRRWFEGRRRLLLIDLPGHGGSASTPGPYGLEEYADSVSAALADAGIAEAHYWGTHTGAGVGLVLAARGERRIRSLVLEGAVLPGFDMPYVAQTVARARDTMRTRGVEAARLEWFEKAEWFDIIRTHPEECRAGEHWELVSSFGGAPWTESSARAVEPLVDKLTQITAPTLLLNGEHDVADFVRAADLLAARLPAATRDVIADAGGFPLWERPDAVNARVEKFLSQNER